MVQKLLTCLEKLPALLLMGMLLIYSQGMPEEILKFVQ